MAQLKRTLPSFLLLCFVYHSVESETVEVSPTCSSSDCLTIDAAFANLSSGTNLVLLPGYHLIEQNHFDETHGVSDITITGSGFQETQVECADGKGLMFTDARNLKLENFSIINCGLTGNDLISTVDLLNGTVDLFFLVPSTAKVALFLGNCENVLLQNVHITNTTGLGLLGINVMGISTLTGVNFTRNIRPNCIDGADPILPSLITPDIQDQVGGGAYFLYTDYDHGYRETIDTVELLLDDTEFVQNADCTYVSTVIVNYQHYTSLDGEGLYQYTVGAGGGLSVILANSNYSVNVSVVDSLFYQNDARYGGGAFVATFAGFEADLSSVTFSRCIFHENGKASEFSETYCHGGAGLVIFTDLIKPDYFSRPIPSFSAQILTSISESVFTNNQALYQGGGVMAFSLFSTPHANLDISSQMNYFAISWRFTNSAFIDNSAQYSSAGFFTQLSGNSLAGSVALMLTNIIVAENGGIDGSANVNENTCAFHLRNVASSSWNVTFADNVGSALRMESSVMVVQSSLNFVRNKARRGGAVHFSGQISSFSLYPSSQLNFTENRAILEGGAIYISPPAIPDEILQPVNFLQCIISTPSLSTLEDHNGTFGLFDQNITILFRNNSAPVGSIMFGPSLEDCLWQQYIDRGEGLTFYNILYENYSDIFMFDAKPEGAHMISSMPAGLSLSPVDGLQLNDLRLFPGETISIIIDVLDRYGQVIPAVVRSVTNDSEDDEVAAVPILGESGFWHTSIRESEFRILGDFVGELNVSIVTEINSLSKSFVVTVVPCPVGFEIDSELRRCVCDDRLDDIDGLECDSNDMTLNTFENTYVGLPDGLNENSTVDDLLVTFCILGYCVSDMGNNTIPPNEFDSQCENRRKDFLCGECRDNYSHVFGTNQCMDCSSYSLFVIPAFGVAGAILFAGIALLEITVDKGWFNVVIFHSSIFALFSHVIPYNTFLAAMFLPGRLITLQLGINTCFYDGMTPLVRTGIALIFPVYLIVLMIFFAFLCSRFTWLSVYFSPAKTLATLFSLCFLNSWTSALDMLIPVWGESINGTASFFWQVDPTKGYFGDEHAWLGAVGILLILVYLLPLPVLLLFPSIPYKYLKKFSPICDVLYASYKPKLRFWAGVRLIVIKVIILLSRFPDVFAFLFIGLFMLIFVSIQTVLKPFKDQWANYMDTILLNSVILYYWGMQAVFEIDYLGTITDTYVVILIITAYCVYVAAFIVHLHRQFPKLTPFLREKLRPFLCIKLGSSLCTKLRSFLHDRLSREKKEHHVVTAPTNEEVELTLTTFTPTQNEVVFRRSNSPTRYPANRLRTTPHYRDSILESDD